MTVRWLARQNDTTTTKLIAKASSDGPLVSHSASRLDHASGEKSSTVVISSVTANAKIASKKVTALANSSASRSNRAGVVIGAIVGTVGR